MKPRLVHAEADAVSERPPHLSDEVRKALRVFLGSQFKSVEAFSTTGFLAHADNEAMSFTLDHFAYARKGEFGAEEFVSRVRGLLDGIEKKTSVPFNDCHVTLNYEVPILNVDMRQIVQMKKNPVNLVPEFVAGSVGFGGHEFRVGLQIPKPGTLMTSVTISGHREEIGAVSALVSDLAAHMGKLAQAAAGEEE